MTKRVTVKIMSGLFAASLLLQTPMTTNLFLNDIYRVEAAATKKGTIKSAVNLRKTASNSAKILKVLTKGTSVTITSTSTVGWYKVKVGNLNGYVGRNYVSLSSSSSGTVSSSSSSGTGTVIASFLNFRKTASNSGKILKVLSNGTKVTILGTSGSWYKVKVGTTTGYVSKAYVKKSSSSSNQSKPDTSSSSSSSSKKTTGTVIASFLNMRKSASNAGTILRVLSNGTKVEILGTSGSWYKVKVGSTTGYVSKIYIKKSSSSTSGGSTTTSSSSNSSAKTKGQQVVNYALQFVGNPYVYGGTSLTKGTDCSGFTMGVYKKFGYTLPRTSAAQRTVGKKVSSLSQAKAGDLICYSGHVAIYMGNNKIVHAANSRRGIVAGDSATYTTILAIRRIV